jgi:hypothetical protein
MVMTILEGRVALERSSDLQRAYRSIIKNLPPQMLQTFLIRCATDMDLWRIISVWKSRAALDEMRRSTETPAGILIFREAGAEPTLSIFEVDAHQMNSFPER